MCRANLDKMADFTEDNPLANLSNNESEKSFSENIPVEAPNSVNANQEIENMEVHHHPKVEKKNLRNTFLSLL